MGCDEGGDSGWWSGGAPAPHVSGHAQAHAAPVGAAGDGAHHCPAPAPRVYPVVCGPGQPGPGNPGLFRGRGTAGGGTSLRGRGGPPGHRGQRPALPAPSGGGGLPGDGGRLCVRSGPQAGGGGPPSDGPGGHPGAQPPSRPAGVRPGGGRWDGAGAGLCGQARLEPGRHQPGQHRHLHSLPKDPGGVASGGVPRPEPGPVSGAAAPGGEAPQHPSGGLLAGSAGLRRLSGVCVRCTERQAEGGARPAPARPPASGAPSPFLAP